MSRRAAEGNRIELRIKPEEKALIARADIVTSNFTPDRMDRWGLGYEDLSKVNPRLICSLAMTLPSCRSSAIRGYPERPNSTLKQIHSAYSLKVSITPLLSETLTATVNTKLNSAVCAVLDPTAREQSTA